ncbi:alpha-amylase family glycosyl hydrolase [Sphingomonas sp.]|jgi:alpha-glucosidase|uniref:alpha-amylase family glycosyl hydrolase n=1 Tax=Sphingomonas sp. TaxID=28214 RepID=UPI002DF1AA03|nr:alpha-amylase family glycosyl hydrolase [Sphingomonas sp.]HEV2569198.1 alpha-amylase family glycosyl hydrolase [Sphingomonas sp.]
MAAEAPWWKRAVFYQIYPRSFADGNGNGVGDLAGIIHRLPYIASLGIDAIWLSPFFRSPMKDYGYDVADYRDVDPLFGTLSDFDRLLEHAHLLGLKLIIDQVWSHTSDQHSWFRDSAARRGGYDEWYVWADAKPDGTPPNNWQASFGGPAWTWHPGRRQYYLHNFLSSQPDLNFHNPAVQDAILDVARFWLDRGVDGFRLDVINYVAHNPALTDNPVARYAATPPATIRFQRQRHNKSQPEALAFVARLRALLDDYDDRMAVGEIFDDDMLARQLEYTDGPDRLHTAYSFHLLNARKATPDLFADAIMAWTDAAGWPSWSLGNHDVPRFPTRLAADDPRLTRSSMLLLLCMRGTPFLYQGDELGLPQARVPFERLRDPFAIASWTEDAQDAGRDGARTPMPWTEDMLRTETWLPIDSRHLALAVERQERVPHSTLQFTRRLLALRRAHPALQYGDARLVEAPAGVLAFERQLGDQRLLCLFELSGAESTYDLQGPGALLDTGLPAQAADGQVTLPAYGAAILALSQAPCSASPSASAAGVR